MVIGRRVAIATLAAALLLSLSACADFWKFQTLQDLGGSDAGVDATVSTESDGAVQDVVARPDVIPPPPCSVDGASTGQQMCNDQCTDLKKRKK